MADRTAAPIQADPRQARHHRAGRRRLTAVGAAVAATAALAGCTLPGNRPAPTTGGASTTTSVAPTSRPAGTVPSSTTTDPSSASAAPPATPVGGDCRSTATAGSATLTSSGATRSFVVSIPATGGRHPIVLDLHGLGSSGPAEAAWTTLGEQGAARGAVVIEPSALGSPAMWNLPPILGTSDKTFVEDLITWAGANACGDTSRVAVAGISNGAALTGALSCQLAGRVDAVGMVAGPNAWRPCPDQAPVPLLAFHGTADPVIPYAGGPVFGGMQGGLGARSGSGLKVAPAEQTMAGWAQRNGCSTTPTTAAVSAHVSRLTYEGCRDGADTALYRIDGGGHTWPGAAPIPGNPFGPTTDEISATTLLLDFFEAHWH